MRMSERYECYEIKLIDSVRKGVRAHAHGYFLKMFSKSGGKKFLPDRESNPDLPRDRRRSSPLDYRGIGELSVIE